MYASPTPTRVESLMEEIMRKVRLRGSNFVRTTAFSLIRVLIDRISRTEAQSHWNAARVTFERCYDFIAANYNAIAGPRANCRFVSRQRSFLPSV